MPFLPFSILPYILRQLANPHFIPFNFNSSSSGRTIIGTCRDTQRSLVALQLVRCNLAIVPPSPLPAAAMRNSTIFLMALAALALTPLLQTVVAIAPPPDLRLRRSRFLGDKVNLFACTKKTEDIVCTLAGSPGGTCCQGFCVDTDRSTQHCGNCNKICDYAQACCQGKCVNTFTDKKNCGGCGVKCRTKCTNGYCDYAA